MAEIFLLKINGTGRMMMNLSHWQGSYTEPLVERNILWLPRVYY